MAPPDPAVAVGRVMVLSRTVMREERLPYSEVMARHPPPARPPAVVSTASRRSTSSTKSVLFRRVTATTPPVPFGAKVPRADMPDRLMAQPCVVRPL